MPDGAGSAGRGDTPCRTKRKSGFSAPRTGPKRVRSRSRGCTSAWSRGRSLPKRRFRAETASGSRRSLSTSAASTASCSAPSLPSTSSVRFRASISTGRTSWKRCPGRAGFSCEAAPWPTPRPPARPVPPAPRSWNASFPPNGRFATRSENSANWANSFPNSTPRKRLWRRNLPPSTPPTRRSPRRWRSPGNRPRISPTRRNRSSGRNRS